MSQRANTSFDIAMWSPALEKFGAVVKMSVALYGGDQQIVCGPMPITPIVNVFQEHRHDPGMFAECVRTCFAQSVDNRPPVIIRSSSGLAVVGVSLTRNGHIVGAVVGGYVLLSFCESVAIARLARETGTSFAELWEVARMQQPISTRRLVLNGQLLQLLGDTLLREHDLRRRSEETALQLSHLASHDPLTNLPNRLLLADRLARALALARRHSRRVAVLFLDIDRFKQINDSLGHLLGDELLRTLAEKLTGCVRNADTVSRHGGDEFVVLLSELARVEDAGEASQKILAAVAGPHTLGGQEHRITVSIGISVFPHDGDSAEALLNRADMALYHAKEQGRGSYKFFQTDLNVRALERQAIETGLRNAIGRGEFALLYQPNINLKTGAVISAEALIRWHHPDRGVLSPAQFVPIAEECGLIEPIGRWVVREACRQAQAWQDLGLRTVPVSVNISAVEFRSKTFLNGIVDSLKETRLDPHRLEIELTESVLMADVKATNAVLHELKNVGVQVAIDNFGTGWSSLAYLRQVPVDALKIDRSFVHEINLNASPIVSAVISLGKSLKQRVIAEGVETRDQLSFLQAEGCAEGQGYYFSPPLMAEQFLGVLQAGTLES